MPGSGCLNKCCPTLARSPAFGPQMASIKELMYGRDYLFLSGHGQIGSSPRACGLCTHVLPKPTVHTTICSVAQIYVHTQSVSGSKPFVQLTVGKPATRNRNSKSIRHLRPNSQGTGDALFSANCQWVFGQSTWKESVDIVG